MEDTTVLWLGIIDTEWNDVLDYIAIDVDHEFHASTHVYGTDNPGVNQAYHGLSSEMLANWMDDVGHPDQYISFGMCLGSLAGLGTLMMLAGLL